MSTFFKFWKEDLSAGLVVFLVAVPLCLGIALASEAPAFSGLIAGITGGIVVGIFSGSPIGVSGPAAGLTAVVATSIQSLGSFELFLTTVVIAGVIQLLLGIARAGIISGYFPNVVIKGMLAAIGIIIILKQMPHAVGWDKDPEGDENFIQADGETTFSEIFNSFDHITWSAVFITLLSLLILYLWEKPVIKKTGLRYIPGALVAVIAGGCCTILFQGSNWELIAEHRVNLGISDKSITQLFTFPDFSQLQNPQIYVIAVTIAVVASLETLLSVDASDKLDPQKRTTPANRELFAQGAGNIVSGFLGGLPITQVVVRSTANVASGGKSKLATIVHGVLIALAVMTISGVFNYIPYATLAAVLFTVGYKLAKPKLFLSVFKEGWAQFVPFITTVLGVVFIDLLYGVASGLLVAVCINLIQYIRLRPVQFRKLTITQVGNHFVFRFPDHASFIRKPAFIRALNKLPENAQADIDFSHVQLLSSDIPEVIQAFYPKAQSRNIRIRVIPQTDTTIPQS